jgi:hypothetical protein
LLVSWCAGGRCGMTGSDRDHGRSRRSGPEDRLLGDRTIGRSGDVVCSLYCARGDEECEFLG